MGTVSEVILQSGDVCVPEFTVDEPMVVLARYVSVPAVVVDLTVNATVPLLVVCGDDVTCVVPPALVCCVNVTE